MKTLQMVTEHLKQLNTFKDVSITMKYENKVTSVELSYNGKSYLSASDSVIGQDLEFYVKMAISNILTDIDNNVALYSY